MTPSAVGQLAAQRTPPILDDRNPAVADVTLGDLILDGRPFDADVLAACVDVGLERRMDGASLLTLELGDPELKLLNSRLFTKAVDLWVDELPFRLADIDLVDNDGAPGLNLELEPRAISKLRGLTDPMHASRADKTRAEFIKALCDRAGVELVCPQLHKRQPIQSVADAMTPAEKRKLRHPGMKKGAKVKVKGLDADSEQLSQIDRSMTVAHSLNAPALAQLAMCCSGIGESAFRAVKNAAGSKYAGVFQADPANIPQSDTEAQAHAFLKGGKGFQQGGAIALATAHPDMSPGEIATRVEASGQPAGFYDAYRSEANVILQAFGAGDGPGALAGQTREYAVPYMFRTLPAEETSDGTAENYWACARRLTDAVNWRLWEAGDRIFLMTDDDILRSQVAYTIGPDTQGVHSVTGGVSARRREQEVTITCDARRWAAPPGTVVELVGYGPYPSSSHTLTLSGRWIVNVIARPSLFSPVTTITLHRRQKALIEPAHEVRQRAGTDDTSVPGISTSGTSLTDGTLRDRVVAIAKEAVKRSAADPTWFTYSQPGRWKNDVLARDGRGHAGPGESGSVLNRSDCSSFVIGLFAKAGCDLPASLRGQGNTDTLRTVGYQTSTPKPGDICLYEGNGGHVELYIGDGKTIGHGDARVDYSTPHARSGFIGYFTFPFLEEDNKVRGRVKLKADTGDIFAVAR